MPNVQPPTDTTESRATWETAQCEYCGEWRNLPPAHASDQMWCRHCHARRKHRVWTWEESARAFRYLLSLHHQLDVQVWFDRNISEKNPAGWAQTRFDDDGFSIERSVSVNSTMPLYWQVKLLSLAFRWFVPTSHSAHRWHLDDPATPEPSNFDDSRPWLAAAWAIREAFTDHLTKKKVG